jgi:hypothetical protein
MRNQSLLRARLDALEDRLVPAGGQYIYLTFQTEFGQGTPGVLRIDPDTRQLSPVPMDPNFFPHAGVAGSDDGKLYFVGTAMDDVDHTKAQAYVRDLASGISQAIGPVLENVSPTDIDAGTGGLYLTYVTNFGQGTPQVLWIDSTSGSSSVLPDDPFLHAQAGVAVAPDGTLLLANSLFTDINNIETRIYR